MVNLWDTTPLGLSLLSLSHHFVVWAAAEQEYPGRYFDQYAILGDDIIITDDRVSSRYQQILDSLGVIVSKDKTLVSDSGCGEFAKKFRTHGLTKDFSPVSFRNVMNSHHLLRIPYHLSCGLAVDSL